MGNVGRTAQREFAIAYAHHRYRRLRGDTVDVAAQVHIKHGITHDDYMLVPGSGQKRLEAGALNEGRHAVKLNGR
ncbi:hypothetical protein MASR1M101_02790 [Gemmatimonas sp.]